jgi:hypothetical protein
VSTRAALTIVPLAGAEESARPPVDWSEEARAVATAAANRTLTRRDRGADSTPSPHSVFAPPSAHHKGDESSTVTGDRIVFVTDDCYQVSKAIPAISNASNNGMGLQTYCLNKSDRPRGDLFDQLQAYKKYHSDH